MPPETESVPKFFLALMALSEKEARILFTYGASIPVPSC